MTFKPKFILALLILLPTMFNSALADSVRCGQHIISSGQVRGTDKYEVLKKCGEPTVRAGDTWVYDKLAGKKTVMVFDASGSLSAIR
jgi:hypothetical protein